MRVSGRTFGLWGAVIFLFSAGGYAVYGFFSHRSQDAALREAAIPACTQRLGGEAACREHLEKNHEECARLTRTRPTRFSHVDAPNPDAYLECVVAGVDEWVQQNGRRAAEAARERRGESLP